MTTKPYVAMYIRQHGWSVVDPNGDARVMRLADGIHAMSVADAMNAREQRETAKVPTPYWVYDRPWMNDYVVRSNVDPNFGSEHFVSEAVAYQRAEELNDRYRGEMERKDVIGAEPLPGAEHKPDDVSRPEHYTKYAIEPKDFLNAIDPHWLAANAIKYLVRYRDKGEPVKDLRKAAQYVAWLIAEVESEA